MTKLTFDIDFNKDPEEILREIQERAKEEVAKRESKEKNKIYLTNLHKKVNEELGTKFSSINDLIKALSSYANPKSRSKSPAVNADGRRVTVSMNQELFDEIKTLLAKPNPNKAAIARETGASVVQVRKVATGGFDKKFGGVVSSTSPKPSPEKPTKPALSALPVSVQKDEPSSESLPESKSSPPKLSPPPAPVDALPPPSNPVEEVNVPAPVDAPPAPSLDLPPVPEAPSDPEPELAAPPPPADLLPPPSLGEEEADVPPPLAPPPAPSLDLPPVPEAPSAPEPELAAPPPLGDLLPPPSLGEEEADVPAPLAPPPAPSLDLPPVPEAPSPSESPQAEMPTPPAPSLDLPPVPQPPSPPEPMADTPEPVAPLPVEAPPSPPAHTPTAPPKPSLSLKPKPGGLSGKSGGTKFSLKSGKKKTTGLKITRPPMKPPSA